MVGWLVWRGGVESDGSAGGSQFVVDLTYVTSAKIRQREGERRAERLHQRLAVSSKFRD